LAGHIIPLHAWVQGKTRWGCSCGAEKCESPGKHPIPHNGLHASSNDAKVIDAWWRKWPHANVGVRTGAISGIVVLDVDPRAGGDDSLDALITKHGALPETIEVLTGGGGRHIYLKHPGGSVRNSAGKLGPGLDIRGDGGYVVGPGSSHESGGEYGFEASSLPSTTPVAEVPGWMLAMMMANIRREYQAQTAESNDIVPEGQRNCYLASLAGTMHRRAMHPEAILAALLAENSACLSPPLGEDEVQRIVWSITSLSRGRKMDYINFARTMPRSAAHLERAQLTYGPDAKLTWAKEKGREIGNRDAAP
jgi:hypothetical protein